MNAPPVAARLRAGDPPGSAIRRIMKLAERSNIVALGLDPDEVVSFAGGWVDHAAPEALRAEYARLAEDPARFHGTGAYSPTRGLPELRAALLRMEERLHGTPGLSDEHLMVGQSSTQLTHDLLFALLDPGDRVLLFDPSYAAYAPQLALGPDGLRVVTLPVFEPDTWSYMPDPGAVLDGVERALARDAPRLILFSSPDNPTSRLVPDDVFYGILERAERAGCFVAVDLAYRTQCFAERAPAHFSASPAEHANLIRIHSNSKWCRGLGRRLGWVDAAPETIRALEAVQQSTTLCPDTLHQAALAGYIERALDDGSLGGYLAGVRDAYLTAARRCVAAIDAHLGMRRLVPEGGLYVVMDVGRDGDAFAREVLEATGAIFVPGSGFGATLAGGVRISYGPLVRDLDRMEEGLRRVGAHLAGRV